MKKERYEELKVNIDWFIMEQYRVIKNRCKCAYFIPYPEFTGDEFISWMYKNGVKAMYDLWVKTGYAQDARPSVHRLNDDDLYYFDNMELTTWLVHKHKPHPQSGTMIVNQILDGKIIATFNGAASAARSLGLKCGKGVTLSCQGHKPKYKGYDWEFADENFIDS